MLPSTISFIQGLSPFVFDYLVDIPLYMASRTLADHIDPAGRRNKRAPLHRFLTVTVPDNFTLSLLFWIRRQVKSVPPDQTSQFVIGLLFMTLSTAQMLGIARWISAYAIDKIPYSQAKKIAQAIGPRDFYAADPEGEGEGPPLLLPLSLQNLLNWLPF